MHLTSQLCNKKKACGFTSWHVGLLTNEDSLCVTWGRRIRILERHGSNVSVERCSFVYGQTRSMGLSQCLGLDSKVILTLLGNKQDPREDVSRSLVRKWVDDENVSLTLQNRWISFWMRIWPEPRGCVWATLNCDSVQTWDKGASELIRRGRRLFLVREVCHRVKFVRGTLTK